MSVAKTLKSLKIRIILKGAALGLILIMYFVFVYEIKPYIFSIGFLILVLFITADLIFTLRDIFKLRSKLDSDDFGSTSVDQHIEPYDKSLAEKIKNERIYTMGSLAAGIIHDFKNPISNISLFVQAITQGYAEGDKTDFYLKKIEDQIDRMLNMTQDFLDYAQGQKSIKPREIEFTETIKNQIEFHREKSEKKNVGLHYSLPEPFYINMDVHKFRRVLDNIVINAFEVLKSGQAININVSTSESGLRMQISDNGPGIPPDILPKIFEPFFTHGKSKGSGLGLSISKKIVEDHGGSLTVNSEIDNGTCFTITLPSNLMVNKSSKPISSENDVIGP